jgi:Peptidase_C39 like family
MGIFSGRKDGARMSSRSSMRLMIVGVMLVFVFAWLLATNQALSNLLGLGSTSSNFNYDAIMAAQSTAAAQQAASPTAVAMRKTSNSSPHLSTPKVIDVKRIGQIDLDGQKVWRSQYDSDYPYDSWAFSTCSTTVMTEYMNFYGRHYRIADVLRVEAGLRDSQGHPLFTATDGTLNNSAFDLTLHQFGFKTQWLPINAHIDTLQGQDLDKALQDGWGNVRHQLDLGYPVVVNFPPSTFDSGHWLIVIGSDKNYVYLVDSSRLNSGQGMKELPYNTFFEYWRDLALVVTPQ